MNICTIRKALLNTTVSAALPLALFTCGGSDSMSRSDTFHETDSVTSSIFALGTRTESVEGAFRVRVISTGVSSGFVKLNDEELLGPSDFHNTSFDRTIVVALNDENTIEYEIRGQPGDQICVRVFELNDDDSEAGIYEGCVDRTAGPPNNVDVVITPVPTPTPIS